MATPTAAPQNRLHVDDPILKAINRMAKIMDDMDRPGQLRVMLNICVQLGHFDYAQKFVDELKKIDGAAE